MFVLRLSNERRQTIDLGKVKDTAMHEQETTSYQSNIDIRKKRNARNKERRATLIVGRCRCR
jgi:hypothetical protein